jgi:hypothetical protein
MPTLPRRSGRPYRVGSAPDLFANDPDYVRELQRRYGSSTRAALPDSFFTRTRSRDSLGAEAGCETDATGFATVSPGTRQTPPGLRYRRRCPAMATFVVFPVTPVIRRTVNPRGRHPARSWGSDAEGFVRLPGASTTSRGSVRRDAQAWDRRGRSQPRARPGRLGRRTITTAGSRSQR